MFGAITSKGAGATGLHYCDLIIEGMAVAVGFGPTHEGQSILTVVVSYADGSLLTVQNSGVLQGRNFNQTSAIERSKTIEN